MEKNSFIRNVYLYLFSLIGLVLMVVGGVGLVNLGLKAFIFTQADMQNSFSYPVAPPVTPADIKQSVDSGKKVEVTAIEQEALSRWLVDYNTYNEKTKKIDYVASSRQQEASHDVAMLIIGLPLYLVHWMIIKKDQKKMAA